MDFLTQPWPWYVSGPLIGLMVPLLLIFGNKSFGISSSMRHFCAACIPTKVKFFDYDWKKESWNLVFVLGVVIGGCLAGYVFKNPLPVNINTETTTELSALGLTNFDGLAPVEIFSFEHLLTAKGLLMMVLGGFLVGFGTRYANGCTSGHSIMGMANLNWPSLVATICFFIGGLAMSWFILPYLLTL